MLKKYPILSRVTLFILTPVGVLLLFAFLELRKSVPNLDAVVKAKGLKNEVIISRDSYGIPSILGKTDRDVFYAMGYVQAQDRLWQMESQRRLAKGRLSEVFGMDSIDTDILMRTYGIYESAKEAWSHMGHDAKESLKAYSEGVNEWLTEAHRLPLEFSVFNISPEKWSPIDSLALGKVFALNMGVNYKLEVERQLAQQLLSPREFASLYPFAEQRTNTKELSFTALDRILGASRIMRDEHDIGGDNVGSNAWAISGRFTKTGKPILANDPHLALQIPSLWYSAKLNGNKLNVSGMTLVGMPVIIFGENNHIVWGGTNLLADVQDLVAEQVSTKDSNLYKHGDQWLPFDKRDEIINIAPSFPQSLQKKIKPVVITVRSTVNGPVVSDAIDGVNQMLSLRWTALDAKDTTFESFFKLNYATNWSEFQEAVSFHVAPTMNIVYADKQNNIGYSAVGRIPIRRAQEDGMLPVNADGSAWDSYIPWSEMPKVLNPESGFIVNANNKMVDEHYPYFISNDWADPARSRRINSLLSEKISAGKKIDMEYTRLMQGDVIDTNAVDFLSVLKQTSGIQEQENAMLNKLFSWNGDMSEDSASPALYMSLVRQLKRSIFMDELRYKKAPRGVNIERSIDGIIDSIKLERLANVFLENQFWCDNINSEKIESCLDITKSSFESSKTELKKMAGNSPSSWRWRKINQRDYKHFPFSRISSLKDLFGRQSSGDGSLDTINVSGGRFDEGRGYIQSYGASFRQTFNLTTDIEHYLINSTGQSGDIFSDFYDDMLSSMGKNTLYAVHLSKSISTTTLTPEDVITNTSFGIDK